MPALLRRRRSARRARRHRPGPPRLGGRVAGWAGFLVSVPLTFLGLLAVTFVIGRVVPIDPVLAIVGDRAPPQVYERGPARARPRPAALRAVPDLSRQGAARRFRQLGAHRRTRCSPDIAALLPGDDRARDPRHLHRRRARRAARRRSPPPARGRWPDQLVRVVGPGRLFGADLLARADGPAALLRQARLGRRAPAGSTSSTRTSSTPRDRPHARRHALLAGELGRVLERALATSSCRPRSSATTRSPISAA